MTLRAAIPRPPQEGFLEHLRPRLEGVRLVDDADACEILVDGRPEAERIHPPLRAVVVPYAGVPRKTRDLLRGVEGVTLHNLHHNAAPTAEMAIALMLAAGKSIVPFDRALRGHDWRPGYDAGGVFLCAGATAVVLGYGAIGKRVGKTCRALHMEVVPVRRGDRNRLHELLPRADALLVCLPWTDETERLLGAEELALLPAGAVLVNVGRGPILDERALFEAARDGRIRAGLDVWYRYPKEECDRSNTPPSDYPFFELDNVVLSPHRAGTSERIEMLRAAALADLLNAAARGDDIPNRVDLARGY